MESYGTTHTGTVRQVNQDVFKIIVDDEKGITILTVCDGMGGANAGNIASQLAADTFITHICRSLVAGSQTDDLCDTDDLPDTAADLAPGAVYADAPLDDIADVVADAAALANTVVFEKGISDIKYDGMGTTLVALISGPNGEIVANIGDSRAYHITEDYIERISKDHSVVEEMIDRGEITPGEAVHHPKKNLITRAVGAEKFVETDIFMQTIDDGDIVMLCSDGLTNVIPEDEIYKIFVNAETLREACDGLIKITLSRGAPDNVTVAAFRK